MSAHHYKRILIVGTTSSGKTTLAQSLSSVLDIPHVELDRLYWGPEWSVQESFETEVDKVFDSDEWIIEGWFGDVASRAWSKADLVIWLRLPFLKNILYLMQRCLRRSWTQEPICNDNRETFRKTFFTKDSIIVWLLKTYRKRSVECQQLQLDYPENTLKCFRNFREVDEWVQGLNRA